MRTPLFGFGLGTALHQVPALLEHVTQADDAGLDLVSLSDHPYEPDRVDAYAALGVVLGRTTRISALANVTNLPTRPAPMLSRTVASLSALSGGRVVLGMGAGGLWDAIAKLGVPRRTPGESVRALEEGIQLIRALHGGGAPVVFDGEFYEVSGLEPSPVPVPAIWTGSNGPKSLAVTGRLADGWIPGYAADWLSERFAWSRPLIDEAAVATGRQPADVQTVYNLPGRITATPLQTTRDDQRRWIGGSPDQWIEELTGAVLEHDAAGFIYFPIPDGTPTDVALGRWATEIAPAVRAALPTAR
ncbi:F420-dependent glucose-6-phosphate dehydrogenase [Baekduia alba]|uniref:LLM class flavin-dependent oxidoreductase n=1 Tax=Baekduia alba TaxID=2997333 RepID=UPI00234189B0|nr:LLM class flavin-dependent oxidoreductase [Baekduia alba]WCB96854.1 F420-dependent glucose-6-phosphate dehydrogenase [Baekduia alba]